MTCYNGSCLEVQRYPNKMRVVILIEAYSWGEYKIYGKCDKYLTKQRKICIHHTAMKFNINNAIIIPFSHKRWDSSIFVVYSNFRSNIPNNLRYVFLRTKFRKVEKNWRVQRRNWISGYRSIIKGTLSLARAHGKSPKSWESSL